jgi:hypothetical protein
MYTFLTELKQLAARLDQGLSPFHAAHELEDVLALEISSLGHVLGG